MYKLIGLVFVVAMSTSALAQLEYWAAVRNDPGPNEIHLFDGPNLIRVVEQFRGAAWDPVGFGDGASSPHQGFFFGWDGGVVAYNNDGTGPFLRISGPPPERPVRTNVRRYPISGELPLSRSYPPGEETAYPRRSRVSAHLRNDSKQIISLICQLCRPIRD